MAKWESGAYRFPTVGLVNFAAPNPANKQAFAKGLQDDRGVRQEDPEFDRDFALRSLKRTDLRCIPWDLAGAAAIPA
ncbi:MAG: hypothetical protein WAM53_14470 [Terrimicrobiaceae bacterium]